MTKRSSLYWRNLIEAGAVDPNFVAGYFGYRRPAIDVFDIATRMGAELYYLPVADKELDGMLRLHKGEPQILINENHHINRQRFTVAHEIGHLLLHSDRMIASGKETRVLYRDTLVGKNTSRLEREANHFGARLLIPDGLLEHYAMAGSVEELAATFQTSRAAMTIRLREIYGI